ncbi:MAG: hypothetical protein ABIJ09_19985 [Pseudomonadota bacterium]
MNKTVPLPEGFDGLALSTADAHRTNVNYIINFEIVSQASPAEATAYTLHFKKSPPVCHPMYRSRRRRDRFVELLGGLGDLEILTGTKAEELDLSFLGPDADVVQVQRLRLTTLGTLEETEAAIFELTARRDVDALCPGDLPARVDLSVTLDGAADHVEVVVDEVQVARFLDDLSQRVERMHRAGADLRVSWVSRPARAFRLITGKPIGRPRLDSSTDTEGAPKVVISIPGKKQAVTRVGPVQVCDERSGIHRTTTPVEENVANKKKERTQERARTDHYLYPLPGGCSDIRGCPLSCATPRSAETSPYLADFVTSPLEGLTGLEPFFKTALLIDPRLAFRPGNAHYALTRLASEAGVELLSPAFRALLCVAANVLVAWQDGRPVGVGLGNDDFRCPPRYGLPHWRYRYVREVINLLETGGHIGVKIGTQHPSRRTRLWQRDGLGELLGGVDGYADVVEDPHVELLQRKDRSKRFEDYQDNDRLNQQRQQLVRYNALLEKTEITLAPGHGLDAMALRIFDSRRQAYRVFNNSSWSRGGRIYCAKWQNLPKQARRHILINGEPCVELDYSSLHVRMLYAMRGLVLQHDPYEIDGHPGLRPLGKFMILILLNARGKIQALKAFHKKVMGDADLAALLLDSGLTPAKLYNQLAEANRWIAHYFHTGIGLRLQAWDSKIMMKVVNHLTRRQIPGLPVHDSCIVPVSREADLKRLMTEGYEKEFKFGIPIKRTPGVGAEVDKPEKGGAR